MEPLGAVITFRSAEFDLRNVNGVRGFLKSADVKMVMPFTICCPMCSNKLEIRGLDDFPYRSRLCECGYFYFLKLVKVDLTDGSQKII